MAKGLIKYTRLAASRLYQPLRPLVKPLRHPMVFSLMLFMVLMLAIGARFYAFDPELDWQERASWRPWQAQANYRKVRAEIAAWEKLLVSHPYSRDILLKLALLYTQINDLQKAGDYFNQAQYLDPAISPLPFSQP